MPTWHFNTLCNSGGKINIGLINDEANVVAPRRGLRFQLQPPNENLADTVELAKGDDPTTSEPADTISTKFAHAASRAPNSFHSTPPSAILVYLERVQKLEAQMPILLHHMKPWMQKSVIEAEDRIEKNVAQ